MILFHRLSERHPAASGRFAYGLSSLPWGTFLVLNFIAAGLSACMVVSVGYALEQFSEKVIGDASKGVGLVMLALFLGVRGS